MGDGNGQDGTGPTSEELDEMVAAMQERPGEGEEDFNNRKAQFRAKNATGKQARQ